MIVIRHISPTNLQCRFSLIPVLEWRESMICPQAPPKPPLPSYLKPWILLGENTVVYIMFYYVIYNGNDDAIKIKIQWFRYLSCWLGDTVMWWTVLWLSIADFPTSMRVGTSPKLSTSGRKNSLSSNSLITLHTQQINTGIFISFIANFHPSEDHKCKRFILLSLYNNLIVKK